MPTPLGKEAQNGNEFAVHQGEQLTKQYVPTIHTQVQQFLQEGVTSASQQNLEIGMSPTASKRKKKRRVADQPNKKLEAEEDADDKATQNGRRKKRDKLKSRVDAELMLLTDSNQEAEAVSVNQSRRRGKQTQMDVQSMTTAADSDHEVMAGNMDGTQTGAVAPEDATESLAAEDSQKATREKPKAIDQVGEPTAVVERNNPDALAVQEVKRRKRKKMKRMVEAVESTAAVEVEMRDTLVMMRREKTKRMVEAGEATVAVEVEEPDALVVQEGKRTRRTTNKRMVEVPGPTPTVEVMEPDTLLVQEGQMVTTERTKRIMEAVEPTAAPDLEEPAVLVVRDDPQKETEERTRTVDGDAIEVKNDAGIDGELVCLKVCAANLHPSLSKDMVWRHFEPCGEIGGIWMLTNLWTGESKGICFITFTAHKSVLAALKLDGELYFGRRIRVNIAEDKPLQEGKCGSTGKGYAKGQGKGKNCSKGGYGKGSCKGPAPIALANQPAKCLGIVVWSLAFEVTEEDLAQTFTTSAGRPTRVRLLTWPTGESKGKAFIDFADQAAVDEAEKLNGTMLKGRKLRFEVSHRAAS